MRRFQARGSSSHHPSPVGLICLLLLSGYTPCQVFFAIQPKKAGEQSTPAFFSGTLAIDYKKGKLMTLHHFSATDIINIAKIKPAEQENPDQL